MSADRAATVGVAGEPDRSVVGQVSDPEPLSRADGVEQRVRLRTAYDVGVHAGRPQALIVGDHDAVPALEQTGDERAFVFRAGFKLARRSAPVGEALRSDGIPDKGPAFPGPARRLEG